MKIAFTKQGLNTTPNNNDITFDLVGRAIVTRGVVLKGTDTTYEIFKKPESTEEGWDGLVPAPSYNGGSNNRFLREDGTWEIIDNPIINYFPTSIDLTKDWTPSGFILNDTKGFVSGMYLIKIQIGSLIFSGTVSVYVGKITTDDEIVLHMCGIPQTYEDGTQGRIYAKIAPSQIADYGEIYLATSVPQSAITNLSITMKKLI